MVRQLDQPADIDDRRAGVEHDLVQQSTERVHIGGVSKTISSPRRQLSVRRRNGPVRILLTDLIKSRFCLSDSGGAGRLLSMTATLILLTPLASTVRTHESAAALQTARGGRARLSGRRVAARTAPRSAARIDGLDRHAEHEDSARHGMGRN